MSIAQLPKVMLADLTHTGPVISSEVFPYGVGMLGAFVKANSSLNLDLELYKFPSDFSNALELLKKNNNAPAVIGFANYSWNYNLSMEFSRRIRDVFPETLIVFGGPNYGLNREEISDFWANNPPIDIYVVGEGEIPFLKIVESYLKSDRQISLTKESLKNTPGIHLCIDGELYANQHTPRLSLVDLPSPYLLGLMDKFWNTSLIPLTATTRGCPFQCTMCAEGHSYYNKVSHTDKFSDEIEYIARNVRNTSILYLSDANFGMYPSDMDKARSISKCQEVYGYPRSIITATGKNKKENVIEVAKILNGALAIFASLQSTDPNVLKLIRRENIKTNALSEIASATRSRDSNTVTELILGLPGDTYDSHRKSLEDTTNAGLGVVRNYQLIMLKQSELNTPTSRRLHKLETKFRIMPRSFGQYQILGATVTACESEEICIASESLSYEEHLKARQLDLAVEVLHNGSPYIYYWKLSRLFKVNWFSVIEETYAFLLTTDTTLFKDFDTWAREFYFNSEAELTSYVHAHIMELISRTDGTNEMSRAKAIAFFAEGERIHKSIAQILAQRVLRLASVDSQVQLQQFLREVYEITELKRRHILNPHFVEQTEVTFDFSRLDVESEWLDLGNYELVSPRKCFIWYDNDQKQLLSSYFRLYGTASIDGLGRLLMRSRLIDILARVSFNLPSDIINDGDLHAQTSDSSSYFSYS